MQLVKCGVSQRDFPEGGILLSQFQTLRKWNAFQKDREMGGKVQPRLPPAGGCRGCSNNYRRPQKKASGPDTQATRFALAALRLEGPEL